MNALPLIDLKDASSFPSRRVEAWKYSDLRRHLREAPAPSPSATVPLVGGGPFEALGGEAMVFVNGRAVGETAMSVSGDKTVRLRLISRAEGTGHGLTARISVRAGAKLLLLESHEGHGSAYVANNRLELDVARGAEVNIQDRDGATALHFAAANPHLGIVKRLLAANADPSLRVARTGQTPGSLVQRPPQRNGMWPIWNRAPVSLNSGSEVAQEELLKLLPPPPLEGSPRGGRVSFWGGVVGQV